MRKALMILFVVLTKLVSGQAISNGGFESWGSGGPFSWGTFLSLDPAFGKMVVRDSADKIAGSYSLRISTDTLQLPSDNIERLYPGYAVYGGIYYNTQLASVNIFGTPFNTRPDSIRMALKYYSEGSDSAFVSFTFKHRGKFIGGIRSDSTAGFLIPYDGTGWGIYNFPVIYTSDSLADTLRIDLLSSNKTPKRGSTLWADSIDAIYHFVDGLENVSNPDLARLSPNPFSSVITVSNLPNRNFSAEIFDTEGASIYKDTMRSEGVINCSDLIAGLYYFRLVGAGGEVLFSKRILKR